MYIYQNYLKIYLITVLSITLTLIIFNWLMNPYGIFKSPTIQGINSVKPEISTHLRLTKSIASTWIKPQSIILGSSTAETGFDPTHPAWPFKPVYNLGLSGANLYEVMRYYQHDRAIHPPRQIVLVLDFFMSNVYLKNRVDFEENLLSVTQNEKKNKKLSHTLFSTLFSWDASKASYKTLIAQNERNIFLPNGQLDWSYRKDHIHKLGGYHNTFLNVESQFQEMFFLGPQFNYAFKKTGGQSTFDFLKIIFADAQKDHSSITIILSPSHVRLLEAYRLTGLWFKFENWKSQIVNLASKNKNVTVWDFSDFNQYTTEKIPSKLDKETEMRWYWDDFHYKKELGDLILNRIFNYPPKDQPQNFGYLLTTKNLHAHLAKIRHQQYLWKQSHQTDLKELSACLKAPEFDSYYPILR